MQEIQREMNLIGNKIKKEQRQEEKRRHEVQCQRLSNESNPRKFFQSVKSLTCTDKGSSVKTKRITDELGNVASTTKERIEFVANRLEQVQQTLDYVGFDDGWNISVERYFNQTDMAFKTNPIS